MKQWKRDVKRGNLGKKYFDDDLVKQLELSSLWASDMAALRKCYYELGEDPEGINLSKSEKLHLYCAQVRKILIEIYTYRMKHTRNNKKVYKEKVLEMQRRYAKSLSNIASLKEIRGRQFEAILDRCILCHSFKLMEATTLMEKEYDYLNSDLKKYKAIKINEYMSTLDYYVLLFPVLTTSEFQNKYSELSVDQAKKIIKARTKLLSKARFDEILFQDFIKVVDSILYTVNVKTLEKELRTICEIIIDTKTNNDKNGLGFSLLLQNSSSIDTVIKEQLIECFNLTSQKEKGKTKNNKKNN